ncbi:MAG: hypothetical protein SF162_12035 [bacterium]|nr:hypothetical protein [bacterium]
MPYKVEWLVPQRVITIYFYGKLVLEDFTAVATHTIAMMEDGIAPIHTLSVVDEVAEYPKSASAIIAMIRAGGSPHPNTGWVVQVTHSPVQRFMGAMMTHLFVGSLRYATAPTLGEAIQYLQERDPSLAALDPIALETAFDRG